MSIDADDSGDALARTEELPVLDVAAYEARLAEKEAAWSRTASWTADGVSDADESTKATPRPAPLSVHGACEASVASEALTINVERILKRIARLEADNRSAQEANGALLKRNEAMQADRDEHALRIQTLAEENARLCEHRTLTDEMMQRSERQLREQAQRAEAELKELRSKHAAAGVRADQEFARLRLQFDETAADGSALRESNRALQEQLRASIVLADQRAEAVAALDKALGEEKTRTAHLGRQLAAKLTECERLGSVVVVRDRALDELTCARDEAVHQLQQESASRVELAAQFAAAEQTLQESGVMLLQHESDLTGRAAEISALRDALSEAELREAALQDELAAAKTLATEQEPRRLALQARLHELEQSVVALGDERGALTAQLQAARDENALAASQMDNIRARVKSLRRHLSDKDAQITRLQADLAVHSEALAAIGRDVNRIGEDADVASFDQVERILEPLDHAGAPLVLNGKMFTVGRTEENDICLPSGLISRCHARLLVGPSGVIIEDAGSTNGCFVNGEQIRQHLMHDGDVLELGDLRYQLRTHSKHDAKDGDRVVPTLTTVARTNDRRLTVIPVLTESAGDETHTELNELS
ncbi:MAG: FHA domain-containing protein [Steroidobacter sp.]